MSKVIEIIERQQKGKENTPVFMVGEQLKEIALREPKSAELLEKDLETSGMGIADAEKELKKYANANKGKANCFCVSPIVAERILREFYGLAERGEEIRSTAATPPLGMTERNGTQAGYIDLGDFL